LVRPIWFGEGHSEMREQRFRVGVDTGGTFTDLVVLSDTGRIYRKKVLSTPDDFSRGILNALEQVFAENGYSGGALEGFIHGTTVATNAVLESRGEPVGLLTTAGFRDVLEIGRCRWGADIFDLDWRKPPPLIPRSLRFEIDERVSAQGDVLNPADEGQIRRQLKRLKAAGVRSVAVCLLNSYANPCHERLIKDIAQSEFAGLSICISSDLLGEAREFERTSTTAINAYLMPVVDNYLTRLRRALASTGYEDSILVMQSNGGVVTAELARHRPVQIVESGPAAGVLACCYLSRETGEKNLVAFDMGGTTAKATLIENGLPFEAAEYQVGGGMNRSGGASGGGQVIRVPSIEIAEVGAGGGSIAWLDTGGALRVGPRSAGAAPGPACYDQGGTEPAVTDAYAVLGYLNPSAIAGGAKSIRPDLARKAIEETIATPARLSLEDAAYGIYTVATSNMIRAVRAVTVERGRDARDYVLVAFGGAGPLHAAELARAMGLQRVLVPTSPGLFSALGLLMADVQHDYSRTLLRSIHGFNDHDLEALNRVFDELVQQARADLSGEGFEGDRVVLERSVSMHYHGQSYELTVPAGEPLRQPADVRRLAAEFCAEHERAYGYKEDVSRVQLVGVRIKARGVTPKTAYAELGRQIAASPERAAADGSRNAYFGPKYGWHMSPVIGRAALRGEGLVGPAIIEEFDTTILVPPGTAAKLDDYGSVLISVSAAAEQTDADDATINPVTIELVKNNLSSIADQMSMTLVRTARSLGVKDARDFSVALCNSRGELVINGVGLAVHLGAIPAAMSAVLETFGGRLDSGDVVFMNDPYAGGMHLPDIFVFRPIYAASELLGYAAVVAHMADVGGRVPGGNAADSTEIYQEGIRIPPIKLCRKGELNEDWITLVKANVRQSETVIGDIFAEIAACNTAEAELRILAKRLGPQTLINYMDELIRYSERMAKAALQHLRKGRFTFVDQMDDDGVGGGAVKIQATVEIGSENVIVDFAGTSPQVRGAINAPLSIATSAAAFVVRAIIGGDVIANAGFRRIVELIAPEGTVVNMSFPAACAARAVTAYRVNDALMGAFAQAVPERVPAAGDGGPAVIGVGGTRQDGTSFVFMEIVSGAFGGRPEADGLEGVASPIANTQNTSCELIEANFPLRVEYYGFVPDTGGAGKHRGGLAIRRDTRFLGKQGILQIRSDRAKVSPWGLAGGREGARSENRLYKTNGAWRRLPSKVVTEIETGDLWRHTTAGGGGWGPPSARSSMALSQDERDGKITRKAIAQQYGGEKINNRAGGDNDKRGTSSDVDHVAHGDSGTGIEAHRPVAGASSDEARDQDRPAGLEDPKGHRVGDQAGNRRQDRSRRDQPSRRGEWKPDRSDQL
jgi:5-oxoprolinase (ATP-hydrolysing)